jgi:hypothetical protein
LLAPIAGVRNSRRKIINELSRNLSVQRESHALIIGSSLAGLLAGRILAKDFDRVTIVEREFFPEKPVPRAGIPQSCHLHILFNKGKIILLMFAQMSR